MWRALIDGVGGILADGYWYAFFRSYRERSPWWWIPPGIMAVVLLLFAAGCHAANNVTGTTVFLRLALLVLVLRLILIAFR
jgi:hypothetical protein